MLSAPGLRIGLFGVAAAITGAIHSEAICNRIDAIQLECATRRVASVRCAEDLLDTCDDRQHQRISHWQKITAIVELELECFVPSGGWRPSTPCYRGANPWLGLMTLVASPRRNYCHRPKRGLARCSNHSAMKAVLASGAYLSHKSRACQRH